MEYKCILLFEQFYGAPKKTHITVEIL